MNELPKLATLLDAPALHTMQRTPKVPEMAPVSGEPDAVAAHSHTGETQAAGQAGSVCPQGDQRPLTKIPRSNMKAMTVKMLRDQGGLCPLCQKPIDLRIPREGVIDHDHITGQVRGVLHRGCNGAEGKVFNAVGRWTGLGMDYAKTLPWLKRLVEYLEGPGTRYMYPTHKTPEEKALIAKMKRRTQDANKRARAKVRSMRKEA